MRLIKGLTPFVLVGLGRAIDDVTEDGLDVGVEAVESKTVQDEVTTDNVTEATPRAPSYQMRGDIGDADPGEETGSFAEMIENTIKEELGDMIDIDEDGMSSLEDDREPEWDAVYTPEICPYRVAEGDVIGVHYYGSLASTEKEFGSSYRKEDIFEFTILFPEIIKGWVKPLLDACPGEKRHIYIPSEYAYGERGEQGIPPDSDIITDVEIIYIKPKGQEGVVYSKEERTLEADPTYVPPGCEYHAQEGDLLFMEYHGTLESNGKVFDSSYRRGGTFDFEIGHGQAIKGWEQGMLGICAGERRHLVIPSNYAYGNTGTNSGSIPPGDSLVQDVKCTKIRTADGTVYEAPEETTVDDQESLYTPKNCVKRPEDGETVWIAYDGRLQATIDIIFDSSIKKMYGRTQAQPFVFVMGKEQAIDGFEQVIASMCIGEKKHAVVPPSLAYGREGRGESIPPDARLDYIMEIVRIDDINGDSFYAKAEHSVIHKPDGECEKVVEKDDFVHVQWNGYFQISFESFQSSDHNNDEVIQLGKEQLFPDLEANIIGMCIGEKRQITVPQDKAFGADGMASLKIPPFTTLVYDIEVTNIIKMDDHEEL